MKSSIPIRFLLSILALAIGQASYASEYSWNQTVTGTWITGSNWDTGIAPNEAGAGVTINTNITSDVGITLPTTGVTVGVLTIGDFDATNKFTLSSGTLTFQSANPGGVAQLNTVGTTTISAAVALGGTSPLAITATGATVLTLSGAITTNGNNLSFSGGTAATNQFSITGNILGSGTITNNSNAAIQLSGSKAFTGTIVASKGTGGSNTGTFWITAGSVKDAAEIILNGALSNGVTQAGGSFSIGNNSAQSTNPGQRLTQNRLTLNGGSLTDNGQPLTALPTDLIEDTVANFRFNSGYSLITIAAASSTAGTRLNATTLERSAGATGFIRSSGTVGGTPRFIAGNVNDLLLGGGGAEGTTTMSVLPWLVIANNSGSAASGADFATSGSTGIRLLASSEYATSITAGSTANVKMGSVAALAGDTSVNSLIKTGAGTDNIGAGKTLTIVSGGLMFTNNGGAIGGSGTSTAGTLNFDTAEGIAWSNGTQSNGIGAVIAGSGGFTKAGTGTLVLTGFNTYTGVTTVSSGTLQVGDGTFSSNLGLSGNVVVANGATLSLLNGEAIPDTVSLTLQSFGVLNGKLNLAAGVNETIAGLYLGSTFFGDLTPTTYGSTASGATYQNDTWFSGTGVLTVYAVPEPSTWAMLLGGVGMLSCWQRSRRRFTPTK